MQPPPAGNGVKSQHGHQFLRVTLMAHLHCKQVQTGRNSWLALLLGCFCAVTHALPEPPSLIKPGQYEAPLVLRVFFDDPDQLAQNASFARPWLVDQRAGFVQLVAGPNELQQLAAMGLKVAIDQAATDLERAPPSLDELKTIQGYTCYRTVEETLQSAQALVRDRRDLARLVDIGDSWVKQSGACRWWLRPESTGAGQSAAFGLQGAAVRQLGHSCSRVRDGRIHHPFGRIPG